ncbi:MAG: MtrB/PioB family outer membrane beta-barrel protein, partial [Rhodoferax sp.]|uniref:MtrB/PioB family outer membrane beta-barrel protein n=1 Tax=Rhodoferax sp. TaxID=50421 RepID=UPI003018CEDD
MTLSSLIAAPKAVTTGTFALGAANYVGAASTCTPAAPCWSYGGKTYASAIAVAAINGVAGNYTTAGDLIAGSAQSGMAAAIASKLATIPESELSLIRKKGGARMDKTITDNWKGYASYTQEARTGARPFAMNENNNSIDIAEPIDYTTHEFLGGMQYADALTQANVRASMSLFRNNISTLNVQYPFLTAATTVGGIQTATYDLYPDNNAFNLKGEFARSLPDFYKGRFNAAVSWGTSQQDDALLAPLSPMQLADLQRNGISQFGNGISAGQPNPGYATGTSLVSNWSGVNALSQQTSKQRIDTTLLDLGLAVKPTDALGMKGSFRFYDTANKGGYMAYNPLTGQFGRGIVDAGGTVGDLIVGLKPGATPGIAGNNCYIPAGYPAVPGCTFGVTTNGATSVANGANIPVYGQARSTQQMNYGLSADYDLTRTSSVNAALEREDFTRTFRERDKTWEDKLKLGYVNRGLGNATLRTSFETDRKRGSDYNYRTFADLGTALPGLDPATQIRLAGTLGYTAFSPANGTVANNANLFNRYSYYFRKYDQADRDQNIFNARLNFQAREDLDLGVTLQTKDIKYPDSFYGMDKDKQDSLSLELNYQPSSGKNLYAFYSYQQGQRAMKMNSGVALATVVNTCTAANLALYGYSACSDNVNGIGGSRPASDAWSMSTDDHNDVLGLGFQSAVGNMQFGIDYTYSSSSTAISYNYGST